MNANSKKWKENHLLALEGLGFKRSCFNRLRALENRAHRLAEIQCSEHEIDEGTLESMENSIEKAVLKLFGGRLDGFFINSDPRGYALKIDNDALRSPEGMHVDWGGYGILAPKF